jgi:hypothetical protein
MHKHRIWLASIAAFGLLTALFPWVTVMGLVGVSGLEVGQGWVVLVLFGGALAATLLVGPRSEALHTSGRGIVAVLGVAATGFGVWKYLEIKEGTIKLGGEIGAEMERAGKDAGELGSAMGKGMMSMFGDFLSIGLGLYTMMATGVALAVAAFLIARKK